jgi:hypothetical protein
MRVNLGQQDTRDPRTAAPASVSAGGGLKNVPFVGLLLTATHLRAAARV